MTSVLYARSTDPVTSFEAAALADLNASELWVADLLAACGPLADFEVEQYGQFKKWTPQRLRTARSALVRRGLVRHSGEYKLTASGRRTQVWEFAS